MSSGEQSLKQTLRETLNFTGELVKVVLLSLAIILPIRYFVVQPFYVSGQSMEPSFEDHEYLLIDEISYRFKEPSRGEVVVFRYPRDPSKYFIKRVIGLPGDTVIINQGKVMVQNNEYPDGFTLGESYIKETMTSGDYSIEVPAGSYFLLGDNRNESLDSRVFGPVKDEFIVGRVWLRAFPLNRWTIFKGVQLMSNA